MPPSFGGIGCEVCAHRLGMRMQKRRPAVKASETKSSTPHGLGANGTVPSLSGEPPKDTTVVIVSASYKLWPRALARAGICAA